MSDFNEWEESFYKLYKSNKELAAIDETKLNCEILRELILDVRKINEQLEDKQPKYLCRWLQENKDALEKDKNND